MSSSNVGNAQVYEAGDQRNAPESERPKPERNEEGKEGSHKDNDPSTSPLYSATASQVKSASKLRIPKKGCYEFRTDSMLTTPQHV